MPVPLHTQTVIAFIWDFDRTLIPDNMQTPIFDEYGVDAGDFWTEVESMVRWHDERRELLARDMAYLLHILTYVEQGVFAGLTNAKLKELGANLEFCPGIPEFFESTRKHVAGVPEYAGEGITVEHYVVSTGILPMIQGSAIAPHIDGIWANSYVEHTAPPGFVDRLPVADPPTEIRHLGQFIGHTSKTRALFEINKGVNKNPQIDVNARMSEAQRRVPLRNMIYIADGPSDVPVFSILNQSGGKTLGVYNLEPRNNHKQVKQLQEQGRIQGMAEADYRPGKAAHLWLMDSLDQIAKEIVENRRRAIESIKNPPGHA
ncbi:MAG: haloacid dehalogenase-like hydrolase [Acidimicrobiia bacterium]|nr:haloacid dehalogenase-like hydrolase [Acidimicrobiia bacterium]